VQNIKGVAGLFNSAAFFDAVRFYITQTSSMGVYKFSNSGFMLFRLMSEQIAAAEYAGVPLIYENISGTRSFFFARVLKKCFMLTSIIEK
jgi:hypothetical protein